MRIKYTTKVKIAILSILLINFNLLNIVAQNLNNIITFKVEEGTTKVRLDFFAISDNTQIKVVSANETTITVGQYWTGYLDFPVDTNTNTVKVYGDLDSFNCVNNNVTYIDISNHQTLKWLDCYDNSISSINLTNSSLKDLYCQNNQLTSLDLSNYTSLENFDCSNNQLNTINLTNASSLSYFKCTDNNLNSLPIPNSSSLYAVYCYNNDFSTSAIDKIYCSLPALDIDTKGYLYIAYDDSDEIIDNILASNAQNAINKNWDVLYYVGYLPITTTGDYDCYNNNDDDDDVNMDNYITFEVEQNTNSVSLDFFAEDGVNIKVVSASETSFTLNSGWLGYQTIVVDTTTNFVTIYGDVLGLACSSNNIINLDLSHNNILKTLSCINNKLNELDLSNNKNINEVYCDENQLTNLILSNNNSLEYLNCDKNKLTQLNLSNIKSLKELRCNENLLEQLDFSHNLSIEFISCAMNKITMIDVTKNESLIKLYCYENKLSSIDVSNNLLLQELSCDDNDLTTLDISNNTKLAGLSCYKNNFNTFAVDQIFCSLPQNSSISKIYLAYSETDENIESILASNSQNAIDKNWRVYYFSTQSPITTTGNFDCSTISINDFANEAELSIYPNPADNVIYIDNVDLERVLIYNNIGKLVGEYFNNTIDVSYYNSGIYFVEIQNKEGKTQTSKIIIK